MSYKLILADPCWKYDNQNVRGNADKHYPTLSARELCQMDVKGLAEKDAVLYLWGTFPFLYDMKARAYNERMRGKGTPEKMRVPDDILAVLEAWGFEYKTVGFLWVKTTGKKKEVEYYEQRAELQADLMGVDLLRSSFPAGTSKPVFGTGWYPRSNTEPCFVAVRGKGVKPATRSVSSVVIAPIGRHSRKPWEVHHRLEKMYPDSKKVELFARQARPGWDVWGNEVEPTIEYQSLFKEQVT